MESSKIPLKTKTKSDKRGERWTAAPPHGESVAGGEETERQIDLPRTLQVVMGTVLKFPRLTTHEAAFLIREVDGWAVCR